VGLLLTLAGLGTPAVGIAGPEPAKYWSVDDVRPGMKGYGCSVFKGYKIERFEAEVLGVLKNVNPGRDLVLVRVAGCDLEKTGVIAGMSGSPVYLEGKLLGAVAYAWAFGKEPIAGVTPFAQMVEFVESYERRDLARKSEPRQARLRQPIHLGGRLVETVTVANHCDQAIPASADGGWLVPLSVPVSATGFSKHSLNLLQEQAGWTGITPVQAGGAATHILREKEPPLQPGSPLAVSLISGDFDLSGIGTVTHIEGDRVYGWGHPFMSLGQCEFPMMSGWIHTIYPRVTVSFKMGSPVQTLGVVNADVSTGIAGWIGRKPDLMPLRMAVQRDYGEFAKTEIFNCECVRQKALLPQLVYTALTNSVDQEGELPEELTADMVARFEFEDRPTLVIRDRFSGSSFAGGRAPSSLYSQIANVVQTLTQNPFEQVRIKRIDCETRLSAGRCSAEVDSVQLSSEVYSPGETLKATVFLKPYKGALQRITAQLKLPVDLPEGNYSALICDDLSNTRYELRESPKFNRPVKIEHIFEALDVQADTKRTQLAVRVNVDNVGVVFDDHELPNLPGSMVEMLSNSRRTGAQTVNGALVSRQETAWVIQGSQSVKFAVRKNKRFSMAP
jgi:hypothetical protein